MVLTLCATAVSTTVTTASTETTVTTTVSDGYEGENVQDAVEALLASRQEARSVKDWARADAVRDGLAGLGFVIEDTPNGARVVYGK